jgi:hypothetical protein
VPVSDVPDEVKFRTSSYSGGGSCVEVGAMVNGAVLVRHSGLRHLGQLPFTYEEWHAFLRGVKDGEFDIPAPREGT